MKKFFNSLTDKARYAWAGCILALAPYVASAQSANQDGKQLLNSASTEIRSIGETIATIMGYLIAIGGLVSLVVIIINFIKGERDSMSKAAYWLIGCVLGFIFITLLKNFAFK